MPNGTGTPRAPRTEADDETLLQKFEAAGVRREAWKHRDHVRIAYLYLRAHPFDEALARFRTGLHALNDAHVAASGEPAPVAVDRGYHETLTVGWMRVIAAMMRNYGTLESSSRFCEENPHLLQRRLLRLFWSRERMMTWEAKRGFVEPDLGALPE